MKGSLSAPKKRRSIELKSVSHECLPAETLAQANLSAKTLAQASLPVKASAQTGEKGRRKIAVKVVDVFDNDTMKIIEIRI